MELLNSLINVVEALARFLAELVQTLRPWTPLFAWIAFWTLAVDWTSLYPRLMRGGLIGVVLLGLMAALIWGVVAPPPDGVHYLFGLTVSNFVGKVVYVTSLIVIMFACGSVQLTGCCSSLVQFEPAVALAEPSHGHHDRGHDHGHGHGGHGHDDHADAGHGGGHGHGGHH